MKSLDETGRAKQRNDVKVSIFEYSAMSALDSLAGPLFIVALILLYAPRVLAGGMTLGTLLLFFEYGASLLRPVVEIAESIRRMQQARISLKRITTIMGLARGTRREEQARGTFREGNPLRKSLVRVQERRLDPEGPELFHPEGIAHRRRGAFRLGKIHDGEPAVRILPAAKGTHNHRRNRSGKPRPRELEEEDGARASGRVSLPRFRPWKTSASTTTRFREKRLRRPSGMSMRPKWSKGCP